MFRGRSSWLYWGRLDEQVDRTGHIRRQADHLSAVGIGLPARPPVESWPNDVAIGIFVELGQYFAVDIDVRSWNAVSSVLAGVDVGHGGELPALINLGGDFDRRNRHVGRHCFVGTLPVGAMVKIALLVHAITS